MEKKIEGKEIKVFDSLVSKEYEIPSYQRPYSWEEGHVSQLFEDLYEFHVEHGRQESYFLGSIILHESKPDSPLKVIDGQQRITTLTILIAALAYMAKKSDREKDHRQCRDLIIREKNEYAGHDESKPVLKIRDKDQKFFNKYVQEDNFEELLNLDPKSNEIETDAQCNIKNNSQILIKKLKSKFDDQPDESINNFAKFIFQNCILISVTVSAEDQATPHRIFSVMNSRGLDLQPTDIIKANVIGHKDMTEQDEHEYNRIWEDLEAQLGRREFNDLFTYIRMIYAKKKQKDDLATEFADNVISKVKDPKKLIDEVVDPYSSILLWLKQKNYQSSSEHNEQINNYIRWLVDYIPNSDWIPVAMFLLKQHGENPDYVLTFFKKLERLAAYLHICGKNQNNRITRYAEILHSLEKDGYNQNNAASGINLNDEEKKELMDTLNGNVYLLTRDRRKYVVSRLNSFYDENKFAIVKSIEHVLPQSVNKDSEWEKLWPDQEKRDQWVHKIANLVPLSISRNSKAYNYDFEKKKEEYFKGKGDVPTNALTVKVIDEKTWTEEVLEAKQKEFLEGFEEQWIKE